VVLCFSCPKVAAVGGLFLHSSFVNTLVHTRLNKMALDRSRVQGLGMFVLDSLHKEPWDSVEQRRKGRTVAALRQLAVAGSCKKKYQLDKDFDKVPHKVTADRLHKVVERLGLWLRLVLVVRTVWELVPFGEKLLV